MFGGLSMTDMKVGSSAGCGRCRGAAVLDICLHSGHFWKSGRCGRFQAAFEATLRVCVSAERPAPLMIAK